MKHFQFVVDSVKDMTNTVEITEDIYHWFLECPPIIQDGQAYLNSEPFNHSSQGKGIYFGAFADNGKYYGFQCTVKQFRDSEPRERKLIELPN